MNRFLLLVGPSSKQTQLEPGDLFVIRFGKHANVTFYRGTIDDEHRLLVGGGNLATPSPFVLIPCSDLRAAYELARLITFNTMYDVSSKTNVPDRELVVHLSSNRSMLATAPLPPSEQPQPVPSAPLPAPPREDRVRILKPGFNDPDWHVEVMCTSRGPQEPRIRGPEQGCGARFSTNRLKLFRKILFGSEHIYTTCPSCSRDALVGHAENFNFAEPLPEKAE